MVLKVCILLQSDFPPDIRFSKEARSLAKAGYEVHLLCNNKKNLPESDKWQDIFIHRLKYYPALGGRCNRSLNTPLFFSPVWIMKLITLHKLYRFDLFHVINLPLAPLAIMVGRLFHLPVIYDMYETYPEAIKTWGLKGLSALIRNPHVAQFLDGICMRQADRLIVVVEEAKKRLVKLGVEESKIYLVENSVDLEAFMSIDISPEVKNRSGDYLITYTGLFSAERGIETAIRAMPFILKNMPSARLVLVGSGPSLGWLKKMAQEEGPAERIDFVGWVDYRLFPSYIHISDVCVIPHPSNPFIDTTIPNKLFEYMALGKPVVVSDAKPLKRIITECQCGEVFESSSPKAFAEAILKIYRADKPYGKNGRQAVLNKYNWEISSRTLLEVYNRFAH